MSQAAELGKLVEKSLEMSRESFEELRSSVREGAAILRGKKPGSRRFTIDSTGVRAIRERTKLSQNDFAGFIVCLLSGRSMRRHRNKSEGIARRWHLRRT